MFTPRWQSITEVANPSTGVFIPLSLALQRGWIYINERGPEYVDPSTGNALQLGNAFSEGRIRLASSPRLLDSHGPLVLVERESFGWHTARGCEHVSATTGRRTPFTEAYRCGLIRPSTTGPSIVVYNDRLSTWIPAEEAVAEKILLVGPHKRFSVVRVRRKIYRVSAVRPGGLRGQWLHPLEALSYGMFRWSSGAVAETWLARPLVTQPSLTSAMLPPRSREFTPLSWRDLVSAMETDWVRLTLEPAPDFISVTDFSNRRVIDASMTLIVDASECEPRTQLTTGPAKPRRESLRASREVTTRTATAYFRRISYLYEYRATNSTA